MGQLSESDEENASQGGSEVNEEAGILASLRDILFRSWDWRRSVEGALTIPDDSAESPGLYRADVDEIRELAAIGISGRHTNIRRKILYERNASLFDRILAEPLTRLNFISDTSDTRHWNTLATMAMAGYYTYLADAISDSSSRFHIWKVVHQFALSNRRPDNARDVYEQFMLSTAFGEQFLLHPASGGTDSDDEETGFVILDRPSLSVLERAEADPDADATDDDVLNALTWQQLSDDPRSYVEIIPWGELKPITVVELEEAEIDVLLPYPTQKSKEDQIATTKWMLWKPPNPQFLNFHALHVDDELDEYSVVNDYPLPGHLLHDCVVFAASPLEAAGFVANLKDFWAYWARSSRFSSF
jgi:hypothetical protein